MANPAIVTLAIGDRYRPLLGRMLYEAGRTNPGLPVICWVDEYPPGAPTNLSAPFSGYCSKPFAMLEAARRGYDILIWLDAAVYPIRSIQPLVDHVALHGYYCQANGFNIGEWCSDAACRTLGIDREESFTMPELSTMAFGIDASRHLDVLEQWAAYAADGVTFMGEHANSNNIEAVRAKGYPTRTIGPVSTDPRVWGHRHDQTAMSVIANRRGWELTPRPIFADYWCETPDPRTVVSNRG